MAWSSEDIFLAQLSSPYCEFIIPPKDLKWHRLLTKARKERTACIVYQNIKREKYVLPESVTEQFEDIVNNTQSKNIIINNQFSEILNELCTFRKIDIIPLKGIFLSKFIYQETHLRPMADIDLLINKAELSRVDEFLSYFGYYPPVSTPDITGEYLNSMNLYRNTELHPAPVHLHWNIINASLPLFMYKVSINSIWNEMRRIDCDGAQLCAMAPHHLLLHLVEHTLKHSYDSLIHLSDIAHLIKLFSSPINNEYKNAFKELDWDSVVKYARAWNFEMPLYWSLRLVNELMAVPLPKDIYQRSFNSLRNFESRRMLKYIMQNNRWQGLSVFGYLAMLNPSDKIRFIRSSLFPPPQDMESFGKVPEPKSYAKRVRKAINILLERLV